MMLALAAKDGVWTMVRPLAQSARREEAAALLDLVGLRDDKNRVSRSLPEGHRTLLDIALALALKPRLLPLDEPTSGVSTLERFSLMEALTSACGPATSSRCSSSTIWTWWRAMPIVCWSGILEPLWRGAIPMRYSRTSAF
jgi:ABC-type molybdenum transport system ATPase subunit/photorepair protein PhrA